MSEIPALDAVATAMRLLCQAGERLEGLYHRLISIDEDLDPKKEISAASALIQEAASLVDGLLADV
jgi:hypothetical protein